MIINLLVYILYFLKLFFSRELAVVRCRWEDLRQFWPRRHELTVQDDCLLWGIRVVITSLLRTSLLYTLHESNPEVGRINGLAR